MTFLVQHTTTNASQEDLVPKAILFAKREQKTPDWWERSTGSALTETVAVLRETSMKKLLTGSVRTSATIENQTNRIFLFLFLKKGMLAFQLSR